MTRILVLSTLVFMMLTNLVSSQENDKVIKNSKLESDIERLADWFTGEFNNFEQHEEDVYAKEKEGKDIEPHVHMHSIFAPIDFPELGKYVFHVQQSDGHNLSKVFRQRIYVFSENTANSNIELRIYKYPKDSECFDVHKAPDKLKNLKIEDLSETGCVVEWKRKGDKFVATNRGGQCEIYSQYFKKNIIVKDNITLFKDRILISDSIFDEEGNLIMGREDASPAILKRCKFYKGWAAIKKEDADSTSKSKYTGYRGLVLHNQGQRTKLADKDGVVADYEVSLSQLTYAASNTHVLKLGVHNKGEKKTVCYIWGEPDAYRLGLNIKWIQTGFTLLEGQRFSEQF